MPGLMWQHHEALVSAGPAGVQLLVSQISREVASGALKASSGLQILEFPLGCHCLCSLHEVYQWLCQRPCLGSMFISSLCIAGTLPASNRALPSTWTSQQAAHPAQLSGTLSWIGTSALGVGSAAAVSDANIEAAGALLYLGQSEQQHVRMRRLLSQCANSCCDSGQQPDSWLGTEAATSGTWPDVQPEAGCQQHMIPCPASASPCLWLPIKAAKLDKHGLERQLTPALHFISVQRKRGRSVLICDDDGADACVCVALAAMLCRGLDLHLEHCGPSSGGRNTSVVMHSVKAAARTHLADISSFHPSARPTRTALKQVYSWVAAAQPDLHARMSLEIA